MYSPVRWVSTNTVERRQYFCPPECQGCSNCTLCAGCRRRLTPPAPGDYPPVFTRYCKFSAHPFFCPRSRALYAGRELTKPAKMDYGWTIWAIADQAEYGEPAHAYTVYIASTRLSKAAARVGAWAHPLPPLDGPEPAPTLLASVPLDAGNPDCTFKFQDGSLWVWKPHGRSARGCVATVVRLATGEQASYTFPEDISYFPHALCGERLVVAACFPDQSAAHVTVWDLSDSGGAAMLFRSAPLSEWGEAGSPISVRQCANGWYYAKISYFVFNREEIRYYFLAPDLDEGFKGRKYVYPSSEVRYVPACCPGERGCFAFNSPYARAADPRVNVDVMRNWIAAGDGDCEAGGYADGGYADGGYADGGESGAALAFVDTEGLLDADDADLPAALLAKKRWLRPLVRVKELQADASAR